MSPLKEAEVFRAVALAVAAGRGAPAASERPQRPEDLGQPLIVAPIERPLLDASGPDQPRPDEEAHVLAHRGLAHSQLLGDEQSADSVLLEIPVHLRPEVPGGLLEPPKDLQSPPVVQGPERVEKIGGRLGRSPVGAGTCSPQRSSRTVISISTAAPSGSSLTATVVRAGYGSRKYRA